MTIILLYMPVIMMCGGASQVMCAHGCGMHAHHVSGVVRMMICNTYVLHVHEIYAVQYVHMGISALREI